MKKTIKTLLKVLAVALPILLAGIWLAFWPLMAAVMEHQSDAAEIHLTHVAGSVYQVDAELRGRQIGASLAASVGPDGVLLVDSPVTTTLARKVAEALDQLGAGPVRHVVNTHPHPDHVRGNTFFANTFFANTAFADTAKVTAHPNTRRRMSEPVRPFRWLPAVSPMPEDGWPTELVDTAHSISFNGEEVRLLPLGPGHTDGDLAVYFTGSNVVHVGDLFHGRGGHTASDVHNSGGDPEGLLHSLGELIRLLPADVRIVCGHAGVGQIAERRDLEEYQELLAEAVGFVKERIAEGSSLDQVVDREMPEHWRGWFESAREDSVMHGSPEGWLTNLYRGLSLSDGG